MNVDIRTHGFKAGRRIVSTLLAVLALVLSFPPAARADHGQQPDTFCGFTGSKTLTLHPGEQFPLPTRYENLTGLSWTFYYIVTRDDLPFNLPGELLSATLGVPLTLPPFKVVSLPTLGYTLPLSTPVGTGHVSYWAYAVHSGTVTRIVNPAKCEFDLTVLPLFSAGLGGSQEPAKDHK